ncbi:c-type cytochrome biogenesis protein CcmI [Ectothiorhodospira mobilis]|uniref:c-type cytochrome biogenesis protein CcmI n=1 Tax=Ectothiorhodospira mobilis TaxID=195064 RepID=UPI0019036940|nr:c-type cytochrome biogenesis protein CcmI [Ectothiorhodospira mobilis]MBK1692778.1 c-type cytochrome biogenesis protein CcmI [Ectothiorhodospira mobilis]
MSTGFWIAAGALLLMAVVAVLWPWLGRRGNDTVEAGRLNLSIYRQRLAELDRERAAGLLDARQYEAARGELEDNLAADLCDGDTPSGEAGGEGGHNDRRGGPVLAAVAMILPVLAVLIHLQMTPEHPAPVHGDLAGGSDSGDRPGRSLEEAELEAMVADLEARLEANPGDAEGWLMLARTHRFMDQHAAAARAFGRAHHLLGDRPELNVAFAESLMLAHDGSAPPEAGRLLESALEEQPDHPDGLWLGAIAAYQAGEPETARTRLERLQSQLPGDSDAARSVEDALRRVDAAAAPAQNADTAGLHVTVELAPGMAERVGKDAVVMVFARPTEGGVPLAVARTGPKLPDTVTLASGGMGSGGPALAELERVEVVARVSQNGDATARSGDLQGTATVAPDAGEIRVVIDRVLP